MLLDGDTKAEELESGDKRMMMAGYRKVRLRIRRNKTNKLEIEHDRYIA